MALSTLVVAIKGDATNLTKSLGQASASTTAFGAQTTKVGNSVSGVLKTAIPLSAAAAGAAVVKFAVDSITAASDLNESLNKSKVIFEDSSGAVEAFAKTAATSLGLSEQAALESAASFGAMFQSAGIATDASADMSIAMVKLAADMASFNNQDPSEMLEKIRSGLAGEAEPLRKFGVFLSEAAVQAKAMELGLVGANEQLTEAEKVQARYAIILEQTSKQQGDFARTSDSLANLQRIAAAEWENLQATLGQLLLPVVVQIVGVFTDLGRVLLFVTGATKEFDKATQEAAAHVASSGLDIGSFFIDLTGGIPIIGDVKDLIVDTTTALDAAGSSAGLSAEQIETLTQAITSGDPAYIAYRDHWVSIFDAFLGGSGKIETANAAVDTGIGIFQRFLGVAPKVEDAVVETFSKKIPKAFRDTADALEGEIPAIVGTVTSMKDAFTLSPKELIKITRSWEQIARTIAHDLKVIGNSDLSPAMREAIAALPPEMRHAFVEGNAKQRAQIVRSLRDTLKVEDQIPGLAKQALAGGKRIGASLDQGLITGIVEGSPAVSAAAADAVNRALAQARLAAGAKSPSKKMHELGLDLMAGLAGGITEGLREVIPLMRDAVGVGAADQAAAFGTELSKLERQIESLRNKANEFRDAIRSGFADFADLTGGMAGALSEFAEAQTKYAEEQAKYTAELRAFTWADVAAGKAPPTAPVAPAAPDLHAFLADQVARSKQFADVLRQLQKAGLSAVNLAEIAAQGPGALDLAQSLLGDPTLIRQLNESQKIIADVTKQTADKMTSAAFGDKVDKVGKQMGDLVRHLERFIDGLDVPRLNDKSRDFINALERLTNAIDRVGGGGGKGRNAPGLAHGGVVERTGLAVVHAGETVTPGGGGVTVNVTINGDVTGEEIVNRVEAQLVQRLQRHGAIFNGAVRQ